MTKDVYVVSADQIATGKMENKSHFLNANARRKELSLGQLTGLSEFDFSIIEVEPGDDSSEHHMHHHEDECIYVLEGEATARIGAESHKITSGDFVGYRKGGLAHSIQNTGDTVLRCIVVSQRKDHDVSDYPRSGKRLFRNRGLTWNLVDIGVIDRPFGAKT
jgi:uncharacterized cupin superfamily protein